jgi:hypothetical protein
MRLSGFAAALALAMLAGCGGSSGGTTPEATFRAYQAAMSDRDFEAVWSMLSPSSKDRMNQDAATRREQAAKAEGPARKSLMDEAQGIGMSIDDMKAMDGRTLFIALMKTGSRAGQKTWDVLARAEVSRIVETEGHALVYIKSGGLEQVPPIPLAREDGIWKINLAGVPVKPPTPAEPSFAPAPAPAEKP